MPSLAASGARGMVSSAGSQAAIFLLRMTGLIVLARLIDPADFGHFVIVSAVIMMVMGLVFVGLPMAANQARHLSAETQSVLMLVNAALGLVVSIALFISAPLIARMYGNDDLAPIAQWLAMIPLLNGLQVQLRVDLTRRHRFGTLALLEVVALAISTGVAIVLAVTGQGVGALVAQLLGQALAELILLVAVVRWRPVMPRLHREELSQLVRFGSHVASANVVRSLSRGIVMPLAAFSLTPVSLANYDKAYQQAVMPVVFAVTRSGRVAIPLLSALRDDPDRLLAFFRRAHLVLVILTCTALLVLSGVSIPIVNLLLGPGWELAGHLLQILAIGSVFRTLVQSADWVYYSTGGSAEALRVTVWAYPLVTAVTLLGLSGGATGMAMAYTGAWLALWPLLTIRAIRSAGGRAAPFLLDAARTIGLLGVPAGLAAYGATHFIASDLLALTGGALAALGAMAVSVALVPAIRRDITTVLSVIRLGFARRPSAKAFRASANKQTTQMDSD